MPLDFPLDFPLEFPQNLMLTAGAAFVAGWAVAKVGSYVRARLRARTQDPRDLRIRSLEAELRVAQSATEKATGRHAEVTRQLFEARQASRASDAETTRQAGIIDQLRTDLRDSVKKTRELREELAERATENVRSELRLREVETELSVVQASTDLIATGMLHYESADSDEEEVQIFKAGG